MNTLIDTTSQNKRGMFILKYTSFNILRVTLTVG